MTQPTIPASQPPEVVPGSDFTLHPTDVLMNLIVALLAPMFLIAADGDIRFAHMAATETVNAYRAQTQADLIAVAQIIAFGLAALGSLSLSVADDLTLSMTLRLRGNANALNRSAEQNRRALTATRADQITSPAKPEPRSTADDGFPTDSETILGVAAAKQLAAEAQARLKDPDPLLRQNMPTPRRPARDLTATEKRHQQMWAIAMVKEASEITASLPNLPPIERRTASIRAAALSSTAHELLNPQNHL